MIPNINLETGIHYGVISGNSKLLPEDWFDCFEPIYQCDDKDCSECQNYSNCFKDEQDTEHYVCDKKDFKADYNSNSNIIMIFFSNNIVKCNYCSPCYPNAGDLDSPNESGIETYGYPKE